MACMGRSKGTHGLHVHSSGLGTHARTHARPLPIARSYVLLLGHIAVPCIVFFCSWLLKKRRRLELSCSSRKTRPLYSRGQISGAECSLLFLSATKSVVSLTDTIISDNGQLIVPLRATRVRSKNKFHDRVHSAVVCTPSSVLLQPGCE
ncbi:hypothetical protein BS78_02G144200 [Paspalum vaginatum]|nr:hypothetical protein BS78_02G144200 [Paspalum vaginatum]